MMRPYTPANTSRSCRRGRGEGGGVAKSPDDRAGKAGLFLLLASFSATGVRLLDGEKTPGLGIHVLGAKCIRCSPTSKHVARRFDY